MMVMSMLSLQHNQRVARVEIIVSEGNEDPRDKDKGSVDHKDHPQVYHKYLYLSLLRMQSMTTSTHSIPSHQNLLLSYKILSLPPYTHVFLPHPFHPPPSPSIPVYLSGSLDHPSSGTTSHLTTGVAIIEEVKVNWVQCNKCNKWRKVPLSVDVDALPEEWYCSLNTWAPTLARCTAKGNYLLNLSLHLFFLFSCFHMSCHDKTLENKQHVLTAYCITILL